jgi:hypothetical protein
MTTEIFFDRTASESRPELDSGSNPDVSDPSKAAIAAIREEGERIKRHETEQLLRELDAENSVDERRAIEELADAIVEQLLAVPIASLRGATVDDRTIETAIELFDPAFETEDGRARADDGERVDAPEVSNGD